MFYFCRQFLICTFVILSNSNFVSTGRTWLVMQKLNNLTSGNCYLLFKGHKHKCAKLTLFKKKHVV
jgi:hypothetical protein